MLVVLCFIIVVFINTLLFFIILLPVTNKFNSKKSNHDSPTSVFESLGFFAIRDKKSIYSSILPINLYRASLFSLVQSWTLTFNNRNPLWCGSFSLMRAKVNIYGCIACVWWCRTPLIQQLITKILKRKILEYQEMKLWQKSIDVSRFKYISQTLNRECFRQNKSEQTSVC